MKFFKTKAFTQFTTKKNIDDEDLLKVASDLEAGKIDANLGGGIIKQRVARKGQGKSGGFRVIICFKRERHTFFVHGFAKSSQSNISADELTDFKELADILFGLTEAQLQLAIDNGTFHEIKR